VRNGSIWNPSETGSNADHFLQSVYARLNIPIRGPMGLGVDGGVYLRNSHYDIVEIKDIDQRIPQARMYLSWYTSR